MGRKTKGVGQVSDCERVQDGSVLTHCPHFWRRPVRATVQVADAKTWRVAVTKWIITHPNNRPILEQGIPAWIVEKNFPVVGGIRIQYSDHVPERETKQQFRLPDGDRFVSFDEQDRDWLETLCRWTGDRRFGHYETVDCGPLFYLVDDGAFRFELGGCFPHIARSC